MAPGTDADLSGWVSARPRTGSELLARILELLLRPLRHRDLIAASVRREISARLAGSALGWLWPFLQPLLLFAIYYFVFTRLLGLRMGDLPREQSAAMGVFMFLGVLIFGAFADSVNRSASVLIDHGNLIKKLAYPSELLPLNVCLANAVTLCLSLLVFVLAAFLTPLWPAPGRALLLAPLVLLLQVILTFGLALACATATVFLRDVKHATASLLAVLMFLTPVFWVPASQVLPGIEPWLPWLRLNPLADLLYAWRAILMSGRPSFAFAQPLAEVLARLGLASLAALFLGYAVFAVAERRIADEV